MSAIAKVKSAAKNKHFQGHWRLGVNTVNLSGTKPSPAGEGWVRGNQNQGKMLILSPHPNLLPEGEGAHSLNQQY
jgi:hypothetical protein